MSKLSEIVIISPKDFAEKSAENQKPTEPPVWIPDGDEIDYVRRFAAAQRAAIKVGASDVRLAYDRNEQPSAAVTVYLVTHGWSHKERFHSPEYCDVWVPLTLPDYAPPAGTPLREDQEA